MYILQKTVDIIIIYGLISVAVMAWMSNYISILDMDILIDADRHPIAHLRTGMSLLGSNLDEKCIEIHVIPVQQ